jgi:lysophospholipase L1-like esterase
MPLAAVAPKNGSPCRLTPLVELMMKACRLPLLILLHLMAAAAWLQAAEPAASPAGDCSSLHIVLVGDSTVTNSAGWGQAFADLLKPGVQCTNTARGGQSTKSFLDGGNWAKALELHPTYVLIQFGHNDMPGKGPRRETDPKSTYRANLIRYVDEARAAGARPILVTSLTRRTFRDGKLVDRLAPYAAAMKAVAVEKKVPLVDLHARSIEAVERLGPAASEELGPLTKDGKRDHTHLAQPGKELTARLVAAELRKAAPELAGCIRSEAGD